MKTIMISTIAAATLLASVNTMANSNTPSKAMKMTSSGEAMHKKDKAVITANQNMAKANKDNAKKLAKK